jgi:hypothetical protein
MIKNILPFVLAGLLLILAVLLMIPATNQAVISLIGLDTQGQTSVKGDFDAFIPFIPGYFPEDFMITSVGATSDETPDIHSYSEFYASDAHFFKTIQRQGKDVPLAISNPNLTIQNHPASITDMVDVDALVGDDLDLRRYDTSKVWLLTVVMKEINVQVVSNLPREEVIRFANEMIPQYCIYTPTPEL